MKARKAGPMSTVSCFQLKNNRLAARGGYFFMYSIKIPTTIPTKTSISDKISKSDINFALPSKISTEWILMQFG